MRYISKICDDNCDSYYYLYIKMGTTQGILSEYRFHIYDTDTKNTDVIYINDYLSRKDEFNDVFGLSVVEYILYLWRINPFDIKLYETIKYNHKRYNLDISFQYKLHFLTEFDSRLLYDPFNSRKALTDNFTLGAILRSYFKNGHASGRAVTINDSKLVIVVEGVEYFYDIVDLDKFNLLRTKYTVLGRD